MWLIVVLLVSVSMEPLYNSHHVHMKIMRVSLALVSTILCVLQMYCTRRKRHVCFIRTNVHTFQIPSILTDLRGRLDF